MTSAAPGRLTADKSRSSASTTGPSGWRTRMARTSTRYVPLACRLFRVGSLEAIASPELDAAPPPARGRRTPAPGLCSFGGALPGPDPHRRAVSRVAPDLWVRVQGHIETSGEKCRILRGMAESPQPRPARLRVGQAAEMLQVSVETLRRWEREGRLRMTRSGGGQRLVAMDEVSRLLNERRRAST